MSDTIFAERVLAWFERHGRRDLPWQHPRSVYRVWIAEIMLQQTQVTAARGYFERFVAAFPDVETLAAASLDAVLARWSGLGYYARARNLHAAARQIAAAGAFPDDLAGWMALPGVGRSTAGAVLAQACGQHHAILDGNLRRLLARHAGVEGWPGRPAVAARLWAEAEARLPQERLADYTQATMDLGAAVCRPRRPQCVACPVASDCVALQTNRVAELPAAAPRRVRPQRRAVLLVLRDAAGRCWLERRPPTGIWGGLWMMPMVEDEAQIDGWLRHAGLQASGPTRPLPAIDHAFTHFDLHLQPRQIAVQALPTLGETPGRWQTLEETAALGVPAPLRRLLEELDSPWTHRVEPVMENAR